MFTKIFFYLLFFILTLKYKALMIMFFTSLLINTIIDAYFNRNMFMLTIINTAIIYNIFTYCLKNIIKTTINLKPTDGILSFLDVFKKRSCEDGILCSSLAFGFYFIIYVIFSLQQYLKNYDYKSPQGMLVYLTTFFILMLIFIFYSGLKQFNTK